MQDLTPDLAQAICVLEQVGYILEKELSHWLSYMNKKKKPFFRADNKDTFNAQRELGNDDTWSAIKSLISFKIEKRSTEMNSVRSLSYLIAIHIFIGLFYALIILVLLIGSSVDDQRTLILFSVIYFIYGFFSSIFTELFITPFATFKLLNLAGIVFLLILVNFIARFLGFESIPW